ncbi:MAG: sulfotransferase, partial [Parvularculaceae bacterium]
MNAPRDGKSTDPKGTLATALSHGFQLLKRDPALAAEQAGEILNVVKDNPRALLLLGAARRRLGEYPAALNALRESVRRAAYNADGYMELALAEAVSGESRRAINSVERALMLDSKIVNAWRMLADALLAAGDDEAAAKAYARHVTATTKDPELLDAGKALHENRLAVAERSLKSYLKRSPTDVAAIRMLAELAARIGRYSDSETLLERCVELAPDFHAARHNLAIVQLRQGKADEAISEAETLLKAQPKDPGYRTLYCAALARLGDYDKAIPQYRSLLEDFPNQPKTWLSFGHALKTVGVQGGAINAYRQSIQLQPSLGEAYWSLANLKTFRFVDSDINEMTRQIARNDLNDDDRLHLHFALGKALEDRGEFERSFKHYDEGNRLRTDQTRYDDTDLPERRQRIEETFTRYFLQSRRGAGCQARDPIFVLGMPRAGSTLVEQILSSHSMIEGTMELPDIISMTKRLAAKSKDGQGPGYPAILAEFSDADLRSLGEEYLERTRSQRRTGKPYFIDKMPNNFPHVGFIRLILPNAKIIDARRHPMACCFSNYKQHFAKGQNFSYGQERIANYYRDYVHLM